MPNVRRTTVLAVLAGVASVQIGGSGAARVALPIRTLVVTSSEIDSFAQDGRGLAWITRGGRCGHRLHIRVAGARPVTIERIACTDNPDQSRLLEGQFALAGGRALWNVGHHFSNYEVGYVLRTASLAERRIRTLPCCTMYGGLAVAEVTLLPLAGSGATLVYYSHQDDDDGVRERAVKRVVGGRARTLFEFDQPRYLAVDAGRIALVRRELVRGDGCGCNSRPVWSPDGARIAFLRAYRTWEHFQEDGAELAVMNADGTGVTTLTGDRLDRRALDWSGDGRFAYGYWNSEAAASSIAVAEPDGTGAHDVAPGDDPEWSPTGTHIVFELAQAVHSVSRDGIGVRRLAEGTDPSWSPDGQSIAFIGPDFDLFVMRADGTGARKLVADAYEGPRWSPDGSKLVYRGDRGLYTINADGSGRRRLTTDGRDASPDWSPDGRTIAFSSTRGDLLPDDEVGESELYLVDADGRGAVRPLGFARANEWRTLGQVRSVGGATHSSFVAEGTPLAVALSGSRLAVLTGFTSGRRQIELFDAPSGASRRVLQVPADTDPWLAAGPRHVVFSVARTIRALDVATGAVLARTQATAVGLSVSGGRLAWAESVRGRGRIRAVSLPK